MFCNSSFLFRLLALSPPLSLSALVMLQILTPRVTQNGITRRDGTRSCQVGKKPLTFNAYQARSSSKVPLGDMRNAACSRTLSWS